MSKSMKRGQVYNADGKRWIHVGTITYDVKRGNRVVIPAGTRGVAIAYRQGPFTYMDPDTGDVRRVNAYRVRGRVI